MLLEHVEGGGDEVLVHLDDVGDLDVRLGREGGQVELAADAGAHDGDADLVVGPVGGAGVPGGGEGQGGGRLHEPAAGDRRHGRPGVGGVGGTESGARNRTR